VFGDSREPYILNPSRRERSDFTVYTISCGAKIFFGKLGGKSRRTKVRLDWMVWRLIELLIKVKKVK